MAQTLDDKLALKPRGGLLGEATTFDKNQYGSSGLMYPSDLMSDKNEYGNNYVMFYINVHEDSMLVKRNGANTFVSPDKVAPRERGPVAGSEVGNVGVTAVAVAAGAAAALAADPVGRATGLIGLTPLNDTVKKIGNAVVGGLAGAAVVAAVGGADKQYKRQRKAIALYMPNELSIKYGVTWSETDLAGTLALGMGAENIANLQGGALVQGTAGYLAGLAMKTPGAGEILSKTSGTALNPKKEQIFKDVDYRTFSFNYQFFPRSPAEAKQVRDIIKEFKLHMHPEFKLNRGQFLYLYPSEFDIYYYNNGKENMNIHRHTSCVLMDMNVQYSPQGQYTSFDDGMPSQVNISLTFRELAILTKENIMDGY